MLYLRKCGFCEVRSLLILFLIIPFALLTLGQEEEEENYEHLNCHVRVLSIRCTDPPSIHGGCLQQQLRFSYYPETNTCQLFTYGGCAGSHNNFESYEMCIDTCADKSLLPPPLTNVVTRVPKKCKPKCKNKKTKKCQKKPSKSTTQKNEIVDTTSPNPIEIKQETDQETDSTTTTDLLTTDND